MPRPEKSSFSPQHIAEFNRIQALRPVALRSFADGLEIWRSCANAACRRARGCRGDRDVSCLTAHMQAMPDEDRRLLRYIIENGAKGLSPDDAIEQALARIEVERALPAF